LADQIVNLKIITQRIATANDKFFQNETHFLQREKDEVF